jgi:PAS domain S-box-containing protein
MTQLQRESWKEAEAELFRLLVENVKDYAIFVVDSDRHVLSWSKGAERLLGFTDQEIIGQQCDSFFTPEDVRTGVPQKELEQALQTGRGEDDRWHMRKDGSRFWCSGVVTPLRDEGGNLRGFAKIMRDRTDLKRAEEAMQRVDRRRDARLAVTQILAEADDVAGATPAILRATCESLGWDVGALWVVDRQANVLRCVDVLRCGPVRAEEFVAATRTAAFPPAESLPGRVWHSAKPLWIADVVNDPHFLRATAAAQGGLHGAFACPIRLDDDFLGVIEFFSDEIREPDPDLLEMMTTLAGQFGQFMERKRTEGQLRRSERELADFFENASVGLHWVGPDGTILRVNRAELDMLGYAREEYVGHNIAEFHADPDVICDILRRLTEGETLHDYEARLRCKDGTIKYGLINSNVLWEDGEFVHTRCLTRDVTERKHAEDRLRESEARLQAVLDHTPAIVYVVDAQGRFLLINRRWKEVFGLTNEQVAGRFLQDFFPPEVADQFVQNNRRVLEAGAPAEFEETVAQDGRTHTYLSVKVPFEYGAGSAPAVCGISTDITERKRAEEALARLTGAKDQQRRIYETALSNSADFNYVFDLEGRFRYVNQALLNLWGKQLQEAVGKNFFELDYPHDLADRLQRQIQQVIDTKQPVKDETPYSSAVGERQYEYIFVPVLGANGEVEAVAGSTRDITERKRAEEALRDADRRKDEFLATLAHELRNPLAPIGNSLQILKMPRVDAATVQETRDMMERQVQHLVRLVDDLLDVSRVMRGKIELRKEPVELASVVVRAVETAQPLIEVQGHRLEITVPPESLLLDADPVRLAQVVGNLLTNAAKYTESNGRIWITAERVGGQAVLTVRDTGIGIAPDMLPHVFDLFIQVDHAATRSQGGLGIGLTLVKNLAEMHGGTVEARSEGLGKGCEFVVRLPLAVEERREPQNRPKEEPQQEPVRASGHRLMVVDDNKDAAVSLAMLLRLQGHMIRVAHDGPSALELVQSYRPAMIFLDIGMPGMDGYEVARRLRQQPGLESVVLVALTGWGQQEDRRRTAEAGFNHHLVKPPEPKALEGLIAELNGEMG